MVSVGTRIAARSARGLLELRAQPVTLPCTTRQVQAHRGLWTLHARGPFSPYPQSPRFNVLVNQIRAITTYEQHAKDLNQKNVDGELHDYDAKIAQESEKQRKAPWHREGSQDPPVRKQREASAMTKGKLLTTPSRLLKLVLPLSTVDINSDRKDVAPLALLVHPNQPLSYLSRLIQSELPSMETDDGKNRAPEVSFRAMESKKDGVMNHEDEEEDSTTQSSRRPNDAEDTSIGDGGVQSYSGAGRESDAKDDGDFIRWSASTEIGDFIRDAARAKEFEVEIEGKPDTVKVAVPSFNDRTYYLRQRLRRTATKMSDMAKLKKECDEAARRTGQRYAMAGCGALIGYWYVVYRLTFQSDYGWDTMEPVTYLVGLTTIIGGYMWFLYNNREVSYRSALNLTISRRQNRLYEQRGFDVRKWEGLIDEANAYRKEIKIIASEYDVDWDETVDEKDPTVVKALRDERKKEKGQKDKDEDKDDDDDDDSDDDAAKKKKD